MASKINDNFDTYSTGDLAGKGIWSAATTGMWEVTTTTPQTGANAVKNTSNGPGTNNVSTTFTAAATGNQTIYVLKTSDDAGVQHGINIHSGAVTATNWNVNHIGSIFIKRVGVGDYRARISDQQTAEPDLTGGTGLSLDTWYKLEIEWDAAQGANGSFRGRINDGTWSSWFGAFVNFDTIEAISIYGNPNTANTVFWDTFGDAATGGGVPRRRMLMGIGT